MNDSKKSHKPIEPVTLGQQQEGELIQALETYRAERDAGREPDRTDFLARYPHLAEVLPDYLDSLDFLAAAARPGDSSPQSPKLDTTHNRLVKKTLGDYVLLREVGRGGMGMVYLADQVSLGRRVALKVLPFAGALDRKQLERFKNEAQAAAHLHHTNIVPVFALGCERGVHYYAMQFIDGWNLAEIIRAADALSPPGSSRLVAPETSGDTLEERDPGIAKSSEWNGASAVSRRRRFREAARLGIQAAEALEHAHQFGVIHRDVKPSNLLLDADGKLWITDFGLAHFRQDANLTASGTLIGTLRYMSPEQALAKRVLIDHRTDIYSLGATLYELCALRPAFPGTDRQEVLRQIAFEEPPAPRRFNRDIPYELETIVLKAMAKTPQERYESAQQLADDLQRFLDDKPIKARRPSFVELSRKWARRHKGPVTVALTLVFAMLIIGVIGLAAANSMISRERDRAEDNAQTAQRRLWTAWLEQARAQRRTGLAGQRYKSLELLSRAAAALPQLGLDEDHRLQLRNELITCSALPVDLRIIQRRNGNGHGFHVDPRFRYFGLSDQNGNITIYRFADGKEHNRLPGFGSYCWVMRFSPDGRFLAARYSDNAKGLIRIWNLAERKVLHTVPMTPGSYAVDFTRDSDRLVVGERDGSILVFDLQAGKVLRRVQSTGHLPHRLRLHPSENRVVVSYGGRDMRELHVRDLENGDVLQSIPLETACPGQMDWSPDGSLLALPGNNYRVYVWDMKNCRMMAEIDGHRWSVRSVSFSSQGDLLMSWAWDGTTRLWDPLNGKELCRMEGDVIGRRFRQSGRQIAYHHKVVGGGICEVLVSGVLRSLPISASKYRKRHSIAFSHDADVLACGCSDGVRLLDVATRRQIAYLPLYSCETVAFHPGTGHLFTSSDAGLHQWPIEIDRLDGLVRFGLPKKLLDLPNCGRACLSDDGRFLAVVSDAQTVVCDLRENRHWFLKDEERNPAYVALSPDGRWAATGNRLAKAVRLWDVSRSRVAKELWPETVWSMTGYHPTFSFSPDGTWFVASTPKEFRLWKTEKWKLIHRFTQGRSAIPGPVVFSPDSQILAVVHSQTRIRLIETQTGKQFATLEAPASHRLNSLCFSRDGAYLAAGTLNDHVQLWDLRQLRKELAAHDLDWDRPDYPAPRPRPSRQCSFQVQGLQAATAQFCIRNAEKLLEAKPGSAGAHNRLAWHLATAPKKLRETERALQLIEWAVQRKPKCANWLNTLGVVQYRLGHYQQAVETLHKARELHGDDNAFDCLFLAMAYQQMGESQKAKDFFRRAAIWRSDGRNLSALAIQELNAFEREARELLGHAAE